MIVCGELKGHGVLGATGSVVVGGTRVKRGVCNCFVLCAGSNGEPV